MDNIKIEDDINELISKSTYLIKSTTNSSFGTGFCVHKDEKGSFLVTCTHVINACIKEYLLVDSKKANLLHISDDENTIDLAIVYVEGLTDSVVPLKLTKKTAKIGEQFIVDGYRPHKMSYAKEPLRGKIKKSYPIEHDGNKKDIYELNINDEDYIEAGYSGSAVFSIEDEVVIAIATDRKRDGKKAFATPAKYLEEIWKDMPKGLFNNKDKVNIKKDIEELIENKYTPKMFQEPLKMVHFIINNVNFLKYNTSIFQDKKLGLILVVILISIFLYSIQWIKVENYIDSNNSYKEKNVDIRSEQSNRILSGEVKHRKENQVYYLFREDDLDINTISEINGSFIFKDIVGEHDIDDTIFISCCEDQNQEKCREPSIQCKIGESCDIY